MMARAFVLFAVGFALTIHLERSEVVVAQQPPTPAPVVGAPTLQMRYAGARLRLARLAVERAREVNRRLPNTISAIEIKRLKEQVVVAQKQLELAGKYTFGTSIDVQLHAAQSGLRIAEENYAAARKANAAMPGTIPEMSIREMEAKLELAQIRVQLWSDPAYLPTLVDEMQWQIDRLTEQVIDLSHRVGDLEVRKIPAPQAAQ